MTPALGRWSRSVKIALDYDNTYTRDPKLWDDFIASVKRRGHDILCVTMRHERERVEVPCEVVYTGRKAKKPYCDDRSINIDIWIDDNPCWILRDAL